MYGQTVQGGSKGVQGVSKGAQGMHKGFKVYLRGSKVYQSGCKVCPKDPRCVQKVQNVSKWVPREHQPFFYRIVVRLRLRYRVGFLHVPERRLLPPH